MDIFRSLASALAKTLWSTMNKPVPGVVDSESVDSGAKWGREENKRGRE